MGRYTKREWHCRNCHATGYILRLRDDTNYRAERRRSESHRAQSGQKRCPIPRLEWIVGVLRCDSRQCRGHIVREGQAAGGTP